MMIWSYSFALRPSFSLAKGYERIREVDSRCAAQLVIPFQSHP